MMKKIFFSRSTDRYSEGGKGLARSHCRQGSDSTLAQLFSRRRDSSHYLPFWR